MLAFCNKSLFRIVSLFLLLGLLQMNIFASIFIIGALGYTFYRCSEVIYDLLRQVEGKINEHRKEKRL